MKGDLSGRDFRRNARCSPRSAFRRKALEIQPTDPYIADIGRLDRLLKGFMKTLIFVLGLCILFTLSWPLALVALFLWPIVLLLSIPFALLGIGVGAALALVKAVLFLPARVLGYRG